MNLNEREIFTCNPADFVSGLSNNERFQSCWFSFSKPQEQQQNISSIISRAEIKISSYEWNKQVLQTSNKPLNSSPLSLFNIHAMESVENAQFFT